ncbi:MAG: amidohydrolase family protein [Kineosporiaceae bacterium]|nr:amidohydrolase family protein [Kineosporiaceae bacterium]
MPGVESPTATTAPTAVDVHAHAMPMAVLQWLAGRGLADLAGVERGVVVLDPMISGVGRGAPLPLARSMYDATVRLAEMDAAGVSHEAVSLPPFLMATMSPDSALVGELLARGTQALIEYCSTDQDRLRPLAGVPVGFATAADTAREVLDSGSVTGIAVGSRGGGTELDDAVNTELWTLLSERETFVLLHPEWRSGPETLGGLLVSPVGRVSDGDRGGGGTVGVLRRTGGASVAVVSGARWRLPAVAARPARHGMGP